MEEKIKPVSEKTYHALSLDGGGSRGLFTLKVLAKIAELWHEFRKDVPFYKLFDVIGGVSVGGVIATAIATGLFEQESIRNSLVMDGNVIFGLKNEDEPIFAPTYTGFEKEAMIAKNFGNLKLKDVKIPLLIVCTTLNFFPVIFQSWNPEHENLLLREILNATCAAPSYFPPAKIGERYFWDGGMYSNNPTDLTILELKKLFMVNNVINVK